MSRDEIEKSIKNCLKENVSNVLLNTLTNSTNNQKTTKRQAAKLAAAIPVNNYSTISAGEYMEIELRDKLLDIEEQIFVGALGSLKVNDRFKWKEALEQASYEPQCSNLTWGDTTRPSHEITNTAKSKTVSSVNGILQNGQGFHDSTLIVVNNLSKALLQIEQSVEKRFLRQPLGDSQRTPEKRRQTKSKQQQQHQNGADDSNDGSEAGSGASNVNRYQTLQNWEKSLMNCTTLSQLFIHLQTLDESIAWSKSALNARCRLCRRKGDAEKMLLCDKCDRGHHIYCLRPQLKAIPEGEWFCPECKPKDVEKTPRKIRKSFAGNEELYSDEEHEQEPDEASENEEEDDQEDDENDENNEQEDADEDQDENEDDEVDVRSDSVRSNNRNSSKRRKTVKYEKRNSEESMDDEDENEDDDGGEEDDEGNEEESVENMEEDAEEENEDDESNEAKSNGNDYVSDDSASRMNVDNESSIDMADGKRKAKGNPRGRGIRLNSKYTNSKAHSIHR
jgi:bromodomain adjacent to zinc finger domain protein 1A